MYRFYANFAKWVKKDLVQTMESINSNLRLMDAYNKKIFSLGMEGKKEG